MTGNYVIAAYMIMANIEFMACIVMAVDGSSSARSNGGFACTMIGRYPAPL